MQRSNRDIYSPQVPNRSISAYYGSQYSSDLELPVSSAPDGNGNSSRYDGNILHRAVAAQLQYQYPTSMYVAHGVAAQKDDLRIQEAQVPSLTSAPYGGHVYFAMDLPDQAGSRLLMSRSAGMDASEPFGEYAAYEDP
ncbi:hypothetical protein B0H13DRAFT_1858886 [Mycena leptocephala]|nr:hypothetical protein B0H13DRAFT_1858886 [Mycena leptocephala]